MTASTVHWHAGLVTHASIEHTCVILHLDSTIPDFSDLSLFHDFIKYQAV